MKQRQSLELQWPWRFQMDGCDIGEKEAWHAPGFRRQNWAVVRVPGAWDCYEKALWGYEGVGWYATTIPPVRSNPGSVLHLVFGRVMYHAKVWLNGELLGENANGYLPFEFDVTGRLASARNNTIVVRVDNKYRIDWLPAAPQVEWIQYGGILEPVRLVRRPPTYISDLAITAEPEGAGGRLTCSATVINRQSVPFAGTLRVGVPGRSPAISSRDVAFTCPAAGSVTVSAGIRLNRVRHWSPEKPVLHMCEALLRAAGYVVDTVAERFGVRSIAARGRHILLNGKPLKIRGVNRYDEFGAFGPNPPANLLRKDLRRMKKSGVNCVRMHYPQNPALLALYDEIGFLVMEEVPLNWWGQKWWPGREAPQSMDILQPASAALTAMIRRDRNHPCVFAWSMANESATQTEVGQAVMRALLQEARRLDPSRLATFVVAGDARPHLAAAEADILCTNIYYGLHQKPAAHHRNQLHELVYTPSRRHLEEQAAAFPGKPVLVTEFGMRGIKGVHGDVAFSEDFQADYLACMLQVLADSPDVAGGMLWSWADYYHRRELIDYAVFGPYGMVTVDRAPKAALKVLAAGYRAIRPTRRKDG